MYTGIELSLRKNEQKIRNLVTLKNISNFETSRIANTKNPKIDFLFLKFSSNYFYFYIFLKKNFEYIFFFLKEMDVFSFNFNKTKKPTNFEIENEEKKKELEVLKNKDSTESKLN